MTGEAPRSMAIASHLQRVSAYCALIGERLGVDADLLRVAAACTTSAWPRSATPSCASPAR